jgi:hypothetical protein
MLISLNSLMNGADGTALVLSRVLSDLPKRQTGRVGLGAVTLYLFLVLNLAQRFL